ncbi:hypothetical protein BC833DRAFT_570631 [Globomyces pollinis-pini]|nr:hypothetical protein BC833DRAFT_570631 [Globomyces pollinis-pini]
MSELKISRWENQKWICNCTIRDITGVPIFIQEQFFSVLAPKPILYKIDGTTLKTYGGRILCLSPFVMVVREEHFTIVYKLAKNGTNENDDSTKIDNVLATDAIVFENDVYLCGDEGVFKFSKNNREYLTYGSYTRFCLYTAEETTFLLHSEEDELFFTDLKQRCITRSLCHSDSVICQLVHLYDSVVAFGTTNGQVCVLDLSSDVPVVILSRWIHGPVESIAGEKIGLNLWVTGQVSSIWVFKLLKSEDINTS